MKPVPFGYDGKRINEEETLMTIPNPQSGPPIACSLPGTARKAQAEKWRAFGGDYELSVALTDSELTIHYARVDDSIDRLRILVAEERACCPFVEWRIDDHHNDLRLVVVGSPDEIASLNIR